MAIAARDLDQPKFGDVAADGGLRDLEAGLAEQLDELLLAADLGARHQLEDACAAGAA